MKLVIAIVLGASLVGVVLRARQSPEPQTAGANAAARKLDAGTISAAAGTPAMMMPDGVVGLRWVRTDVAVTVDGLRIQPFAGLSSDVGFTAAPQGTIVTGDIVVFEDEIGPAMDAAFASGLEVTALHNHFSYDEPKVSFMHIGGVGDETKLAVGIKAVRSAIGSVRSGHPRPATSFPGGVPTAGTFDAAAIGRVLGVQPRAQDGIVMAMINREGTMHGVKVGRSMGLATTVAFSGSDSLAVVYGDFIATAGELQAVLKALRKPNIHIVAVHNHMVGDQPAFYFTHFWGKGKAAELARGIASAFDAQRAAGGNKQ